MIKRFLSWLRGDRIVERAPDRRPTQPGDTRNLINTTLVSMSAEDTANWLRDPSGVSWLDHTPNETLKARLVHMNARVRIALFESVDLFIIALEGNSDLTATRLRELKHAAEAGDEHAMYQMVVIVGQLINTAFAGVKR